MAKTGRYNAFLGQLVTCFFCAMFIGAAQGNDAEELIATGDWKRARALVEERIRVAPADPLGNFLLSQIRNAFGDRATPLPLAEKAVALDGRVGKYHRQLAEAGSTCPTCRRIPAVPARAAIPK